MSKRFALYLLALALVNASVQKAKRVAAQQNIPAPAAAGPNLAGAWEGTLDVEAAKLRLVLKVSKAADGTLAAKMDSLNQGANDLPVDVINLKESTVHFEMKPLFAEFDGTVNKEGPKSRDNSSKVELLSR